MMPGINGVEATRIIREEIDSDYARNVPIIALTANAIMGNEEMFLSRGFQAFIAKPIDISRLDTVLRQCVRDKDQEALLDEKMINIEVRRGVERRLLLDDVPGLDVDKGIMHFGFSEDSYFKVLQSYLKNTRALLGIIKGVRKDNLDIYGVTIHGIKSSSHGIFASSIGSAAEALEKAAYSGDFDYIKSHNQSFLDKITRLLDDIEVMLTKSGMEQKQIKVKPEKALLIKLHDACESFDIDEIDLIMDEIEQFDYISDDGLVVWIRENIDQGLYRGVKEKLSSFIIDTEE